MRGFDRLLERELRKLARERGVSLSQAALELMRRGAGLARVTGVPPRIGNSLDRFIGTLAPDDAKALAKAVEQFETLDPSLWK